ncbi:hypothetical protein EJE23_21100 [Enterobacter chengduensis]|uniref:hypothetical protein n=1 Tax=Enterobacter chengduensis TaxID=2494701 RepID=UPI000F68E7CD|nr:hypothetical protein [Enterobacter chengduensis]RSK52311.1 hypothetical protein EJE23_21100 [Enterobacter chengduensis]
MTANKPMTGEQLDELMTIAVNMQRDSEKSGDRPTAMFAYAVQVADMELRKVRDDAAALAAENAGLKSVDVWMNADEVGGSAADKAIENGATPEEATRAGVQAVIDSFKTPTTNTFLAEVRASAIPEGYVLVPQEMHLSSEAMEGICFHCGDGDHNFGEFTDGTLFVGDVDYGDGKKVHGLHIATADYPEEGCATICEFAAQLRKGVQS